MVLASTNQMGGVIKDGLRRMTGVLFVGVLATVVVWLFKNEHFMGAHKIVNSDAVIVALAGVVVMFAAQVFAEITHHHQIAVLVSQLFIKCCFAGKTSGYYDIFSIVAGTVTGVVMISIVSVVIFPRSSSYKAIIDMRLALEKLETLSKLTMDELITTHILATQNKSEPKDDEVQLVVTEDREYDTNILHLTMQINQEDDKLRQFENIMYEMFELLDKMKQSLELSKNEVCMWVRETKDGPRWILFPGAKMLRCLCSNRLPYDGLEYVSVNCRRVARHLWAVLLSIDHMWDETVQEVLKQRYPQQVLPQIRNLTTKVLNDIACAFPGQHYVTMRHLSPLEMAVELMLNISNRWRTRAAIKQKTDDSLIKQGRQRALKRALTRANSSIKRTPQSLNSRYDVHKLGKAVGRSRRVFETAALASPILDRMSSQTRQDQIEDMMEQALSQNPPLKQRSGVRFAVQEEETGELINDNTQSLGETSMLESSSSSLSVGRNIKRSVFGSRGLRDNLDPDVEVALLKAEDEASQGGLFKKLKKMRSVRSKKNLQVEVTQESRQKRREAAKVHGEHPSLGDISFLERSSQISNLASVNSTDSFGDGVSRTMHRMQTLDINSMIVDVPLIEEQQALSFPETEEGHTQEARWYSFQFQIDELLDALIELHTSVSNLLEYHLPKLSLSPKLIQRYKVD
eukprot:TRINITY_DN2154_c0_g1_i1.p1 TRINITY_DN2154_c0_g1~~TRINITY_DN2154_c0_g1_i1.p1  ORF type:complete len:774 (-),score=72.93 TRINITY_DN2154_c0_g1_i1:679-2736(-)